jgi:hypothetical protein
MAHKLDYDLRISRGLELLPAMGWELSRPTFNGEHVTLEATKGDAKIVLADTLTLLPRGLEHVGNLLDCPKLPLPDEDGPEEEWWARCTTDVEILARAYMIVVDWLSRQDLGGWARTGPGIGWHTLLRRHMHHSVLVHGRPEVREAEAAAMYAGRAEVWRHGQLHHGPYHEWDYALAYANVCRESYLPSVLMDQVARPKLDRIERSWPTRAWLVKADVSTDVPVLPVADDIGVLWPVGTFQGWWWDVELVEAARAGAVVAPLTAWRYVAAPWLASWAEWAIGVVADDTTPEARVRALAAKHWTRTIVGRSAMRYRSWEDQGAAWSPGASYMPMLDRQSGERGACLTLGNQRWEAWGQEWWGDALPQLLGAVMARCRVNLWRSMAEAGHKHLVYMDTDSLIVDRTGHDRLKSAAAAGRLGSMRYKGSHDTLEVTAPQLVEGSTYRRLAGVPKGAQRTGHDTYDGEVWEGITTSMAEGHPGEVRIRRAQIALSGLDTRRAHLPGGATAPFTMAGGVRQARQEKAS